jgi:hypothetical protein
MILNNHDYLLFDIQLLQISVFINDVEKIVNVYLSSNKQYAKISNTNWEYTLLIENTMRTLEHLVTYIYSIFRDDCYDIPLVNFKFNYAEQNYHILSTLKETDYDNFMIVDLPLSQCTVYL